MGFTLSKELEMLRKAVRNLAAKNLGVAPLGILEYLNAVTIHWAWGRAKITCCNHMKYTKIIP